MSKSIDNDKAFRKYFHDDPDAKIVKQTAVASKVLVVLQMGFFAKRDKKGAPTYEVSTKTTAEVAEKYKHIVLVEKTEGLTSDYTVECTSLLLRAGATAHIVAFSIDNVTQWLIDYVEALKSLGIVTHKVRNPRLVTQLNVDREIKDPRIQYVRVDDHKLLGLEPDKEPCFQDFAKVRAKASWI